MKKLSVVLVALVLIFSCKKDKDKDSGCSKNVTSISGTYKITAYTYKATLSSSEVDYYSILFPDACDRDNLLKFDTNGSYQLIDAGIVCSPSGNDNGTWSISGNSMVVDGDETIIESFDCKTLVLSSTDVDQPGDKLKITLTRE
jgi:Lipocalin-like domain